MNINLREDANKYVEGLTYGQGLMIGLSRLSWLQPNVTYTHHTLNGAGQVLIPVVENLKDGAVTELCAEGEFSKSKGRYETLLLDKKVGAEFDGCFTVSGIANKDWELLLNNASLRQMAIARQIAVETELVEQATASAIDKDDKPFTYLNKLKNEYYVMSGLQPTIALVSLDYYNEILDAQVQMPQAVGEYAYVNGVVGMIAGMAIIPAQITVDAVLINPQAINLASAGALAQVPQFGNIIGMANLGEANGIGFDAGLISKTDVNPKYVGATTYVHQPFGIKIISNLALAAGVGAAGEPDVKAGKSAK